MFRICSAAAITAWTLVLSTPTHTSAAVTYDTRVLTGDQAPGKPAGVVFDNLLISPPALNAAGQTAFRAFLTDPDGNSMSGVSIWSEGSGSLNLVAQTGDPAPGTAPGVVYNSLAPPVLNTAGQTAFLGLLGGTGVDSTNRFGVWSEGSGSLDLVAREGDAASGTAPGVIYHLLGSPVLNNAGKTAFFSRLTGPDVDSTNDRGFWSEGSGSLELMARVGDSAPGTESGVVYGLFNSSIVLNGAGQAAFFGGLTGTGVDSTNDRGVWSGGTDSLDLMAREGDAAPGTGAVYSFLDVPALNGMGQAAFTSFLAGPGVEGTNDSGVWSGKAGSLQLVVREGDAAPGTQPGVVYGEFGRTRPMINGVGQTAFWSSLTGSGVDGSNHTGIWSEGGGSLALVARQGESAPGTAAGVVFDDFQFVGNPVLNGAGQTAFKVFLTGPGIDFTNDQGIWATDPNGELTLIARTGELFDVNDDPLIDDLRTISGIILTTGSGGEDGRPTSFNDAGQLAFHLEFTDGSEGIFVATIGLTGDLNGDGFVGIEDLGNVLGNWNANVTPGDPFAGDPTGDGFVGIEDLNVVLGNWNAGTPPPPTDGAVIPEPASLMLFAGVLGALATRRR